MEQQIHIIHHAVTRGVLREGIVWLAGDGKAPSEVKNRARIRHVLKKSDYLCFDNRPSQAVRKLSPPHPSMAKP